MRKQKYIRYDVAVEHPVQHYLMASYLYYIKDESLMLDTEYDQLCKYMDAHWDEISHYHKDIIDRSDLPAGTAMSLNEEDYPSRVAGAAYSLLRSLV